MDRGNNKLNSFSAKDDMNMDLIPGVPIVEIYGRCRVLIENHQGVIGYGTGEIKVKVRNGCICVCGECLKLARLSRGKLVITGLLKDVRMSGRD